MHVRLKNYTNQNININIFYVDGRVTRFQAPEDFI